MTPSLQTHVFDLEIKDGALTREDSVLRVKRDDQVVLNITSDVTAEFPCTRPRPYDNDRSR